MSRHRHRDRSRHGERSLTLGEVLYRKRELVERSAGQRQALASASAGLQPLLAAGDRVAGVGRALLSRPLLLAGAGAVVLILWPRAVLSVAARALGLWKGAGFVRRLLAVTLLLTAPPSLGLADGAPVPVGGAAGAPAALVGDFAEDAAGRAGPVYQLHPRADALTMGAAALAISLPSLLAEELITARCPCDPSSVNRFDRRAIGNHDATADVASNVTVLAALLGPPLLALGADDVVYSDLTVFAETLLVNGALVEAAKYVFQRPLPRTYAGDASLVSSSGGYRSFYSGHTSTAFAALTATAYTMRLRQGEQVWPWVVAVGVGASVGVERVLAGRHFPSDVIVGAIAGTAVGIGVPWLHTTTPRVTVVPSPRGIGIVAEL